jgi:hypothetical protein
MDSHQTFANDIKIENDFVQFDQPWGDISHQQYDGYRNPLDWTMSSTEGTSSSNINDELEDEKENIEVAFLEVSAFLGEINFIVNNWIITIFLGKKANIWMDIEEHRIEGPKLCIERGGGAEGE